MKIRKVEVPTKVKRYIYEGKIENEDSAEFVIDISPNRIPHETSIKFIKESGKRFNVNYDFTLRDKNISFQPFTLYGSSFTKRLYFTTYHWDIYGFIPRTAHIIMQIQGYGLNNRLMPFDDEM